LFELKVQIG